MVECVKCKVTISNRNKFGLCRNCYENKDNAVHYNAEDKYNDRSIDDLNNGLITDSSEAMKNTSLNNLSVVGIMNLISIVNIPIVEKLNGIRDNLRPRVEQIMSKVEHLEKDSKRDN